MSGLISFILVILTLVCFAVLVLGVPLGLIMLLVSLGMKGKEKEEWLKKGKKVLSIALKALLGLVAIAICYAAISLVLSFLGFPSLGELGV